MKIKKNPDLKKPTTHYNGYNYQKYSNINVVGQVLSLPVVVTL